MSFIFSISNALKPYSCTQICLSLLRKFENCSNTNLWFILFNSFFFFIKTRKDVVDVFAGKMSVKTKLNSSHSGEISLEEDTEELFSRILLP